VVADGVAYAPHRAIDVQAWDVDWYVYSTYKVYGPHMAVMVGKTEAFEGLTGPNHFFIPTDDLPYKFEPGGANHESCAGLLGLGDYLKFLTGSDPHQACDRSMVEAGFARMAAWEIPLIERLLGFLNDRPEVRVIGPQMPGPDRVGTISFVHDTLSSKEISDAVDRTRVAIRYGHMYAWHLCDALGLPADDGVVRVSFVHYNTLDEIEELISVLDRIL
jgi:selenocysteine lyase/cysteine desulfurase